MSTPTATQQPTPSSSLKRLINRHPLVAYFVLAFAGTWIPLLPLVLSQDGIGLLAFRLPDVAAGVLFILSGFTGPTLAAFIVTAATSGKAGVRHLLRRYVQWRVGVHWYLLVLFGYPIVFLLGASVVLGATPLNALIQQWPLIFSSYLPSLLTFHLITRLGEEPGWRGFALPRLQQQYGALLGSLILGTLHAAWHLPLFFIPAFGVGALTIPSFVTFVLSGMPHTLLWTWIYNNTRGSLLMMILVHSASGAAQSFLLQLIPVVPNEADVAIWINRVLGACALLIIIFTRGRLSYKPNHVSQTADAPLTKE